MAQVRIEYGPADWADALEKEVGKRSAAHFRLGTGSFARLSTNTWLKFGEVRVPPSHWYLGLARSAAGAWSLSLMDSSKVLRAQVDAAFTPRLKPDLLIPLSLTRHKAAVPRLRVRLQAPGGSEAKASRLVLRWHRYRLRADFEISAVTPAADIAPRFRKLDPKRALTTATGLKIWKLRHGVGRLASKTGAVKVHYALWLTDGKKLESSVEMGRPLSISDLSTVIDGWREALSRMRAGGVAMIEVPPALGYGARGMGEIPSNATLVFWIKVLEVK